MQDPGFVRRAFAEIADRYVVTNHVLSLGTGILWRRRFVRGIKADRVLDVATGSGDVAREVQRQCPGTQVVGIDFCLPMLRHARNAGIRDLVVTDALNLPFADRTFDAVTVAFGLRNMASWKDALAEWNRVLKPGGNLHVLDFSLPTWQPLRGLYLFYLRRLLPRIAGWMTGRHEAYEYLSSSIGLFPYGSAMRALIAEAGFVTVSSQPLSGGIASIYRGVRPSR